MEIKLGKSYKDSSGFVRKIVHEYTSLDQPYKLEGLCVRGYAYFDTQGNHRNKLYRLTEEVL
jgi:hypothetical protein